MSKFPLESLRRFKAEVFEIAKAAGCPKDAVVIDWLRDRLAELPAPPTIRPLDREVLGEILGNLDEIEAALGGLPHREAAAPIRIIQGVRELLGDCLPGGYIGNCEYCEKPIGLYEVGASDPEDGGHACKACVAQDPEHFSPQEPELLDPLEADHLPAWADRYSDGDPMVPMTQLLTRDGRRVGNAVVLGIEAIGDQPIAVVRTDAGNVIRLTREELDWYFHPPIFILLSIPGQAEPNEPAVLFDTEQREPPAGDSNTASEVAPELPPGFSIAEDGALIVPDRDDRGTEITRLRGSRAFLDQFSEIRTVSGRALKSATAELPAREAQELQLLRQLLRGPYASAHSATKAIAERLLKKGQVFFYVVDGPLAQLEITRAGKMRLEGGNG